MMDETIHRFAVGAFECVALLDSVIEHQVASLIENVDHDAAEPGLAKYGLKKDGKFLTTNTCLLIKTRSQRVLIDTGYGDVLLEEWMPGGGRLLNRLTDAGEAPGDIDVVVLTHGHGDHIGGNVDRAGRIPFPNAQWVIAREEWSFWSSPEKLKDSPPEDADIARRKLLPLSDRLRLTDGEMEIVPGIFSLPLPGHTPGHMGVRVRSRGEELLVVADAILHPLNVEYPAWCAVHWADMDWDGVVESRRRLYARAEAEHALVLAYHFAPFPSLGYIVQVGDGWRWAPYRLSN